MSLIAIAHVKQIATQIMKDLGAGYSEACYQAALHNKLIKIDPSTKKEKTAPVIYEEEVIGTCRADIVTAEHIIEVKAMNTLQPKVIKQICKYMVHFYVQDQVPRSGIVINFNQDTEQIEFVVLDPTTLEVSTTEFKRTRTNYNLGLSSQNTQGTYNLSEEQLARIARNKAAALAQRQMTLPNTCSPSQQPEAI